MTHAPFPRLVPVITLMLFAILTASARAGEVRTIPVEFMSENVRLVGRLHVPASLAPGQTAPGVVVTGAWFTVKEQMADHYAKQLASRGIVALSFDFTGWGESEGAIRQVEDPTKKIADLRAAAGFLRSRPEVGGERVGALGICASAGYAVHAANASDDIASVALVAPWLHDRAIVEVVYGGSESVARLIDVAREARTEFEKTGRQSFIPAASRTDQRALMFNVPYYTETDRGMIAAWRNEVDPMFWEGWLTFDAQTAAPQLTQPLLIVHSDAAAIPQGARQFYAAVTAPKQELWLENVSQFDFYDREAPVKAAADAVAAFLTTAR